MLTAVAYSDDIETGLSPDDMRIVTALIHCRFRGLFSGITQECSPDGQPVLVVWGTACTDEPLLTISGSNGRYVVIEEPIGQVFETDTIEEALERARAKFPQITAL